MPTSTEFDQHKAALLSVIKAHAKLNALACAHIVDKHGLFTVPAFLEAEELSEADKLATLKEIAKGLAAAHTGKPHGLRGTVPAAQQIEAKAPTPALKQRVTPDVPEHPLPRRDSMLPEVPPPPAKVPDDPLTAQFRKIILEIIGPVQADAKVDEGKVREIAELLDSERNTTLRAECDKRITDEVARLREEMSGSVARKLDVTFNGQTNTVDGITHKQLPQILRWVAAGVPVWLWGPAGGGKTTLGEQIAKALGLPFYCVSIDETITVGKLTGFKNLATGDHVEGLIYRAYKDGGLLLLDEIDTNSCTIAALNAMLANGHYTFGNGERVARHDSFRVIAGANTKGTGAVAGYTARVRLDAATLDRFAVIELEYDWDMVKRITGPSAWVDWVQGVNRSHGKSALISPRAAILGHRALCAGVPQEEVAASLVFKLLAPDTVSSIRNQHPLPSLAVAA